MNREKIDQYIAELLESHDCVIVPDFGGFVGNYAPATIHPINHRFDPPFRKISFNKLLTHNDGLLAAYAARMEQKKYEEAVSLLKDYVVVLKDELNQSKKLRFDRIGVLHKRSDGSFQFEQLKESSFFGDGFGLEKFFANPIETPQVVKATIEPKAEKPEAELPKPSVIQLKPEATVEETEIEEKELQEKRKRQYWPAIAAGLAIPIIGYAIWISISTPLFKDTQNFQYSDLNPFVEKVCPEYSSRNHFIEMNTENEPLSLVVDSSSKFIEIFESENRDKTLVISLEEKVENAPQISLPYHVVGGCFGEIANAEGLAEKYRRLGNNASIVEKKGNLYRVSVASYATREKALEALGSMQNEIPNAWILYK